MCVITLKSSHRPDGKMADALASTLACTTAADALVNYSAMFTDVYVLQRSEISHCPNGKIAHALALILACATATDALVNYSLYVPQRPRKFPSPRWEDG